MISSGRAGAYANIFVENGINGRKLVLLDKIALEILGINENDLEPLLKSIETWKKLHAKKGNKYDMSPFSFKKVLDKPLVS